jgi:hypothetical protein
LDSEWAKQGEGRSISTYGLLVAPNTDLLKVAGALAASAELKPTIQKELETERSALRTLLQSAMADEFQLRAVSSRTGGPSHFPISFLRALHIEREVLVALLAFYDSEEFVRKGKGNEEFTLILAQAPGRLLEALTFWESAKVRFEVAIKRGWLPPMVI